MVNSLAEKDYLMSRPSTPLGDIEYSHLRRFTRSAKGAFEYPYLKFLTHKEQYTVGVSIAFNSHWGITTADSGRRRHVMDER